MTINGINFILIEPLAKKVPVKTHRRKNRRIRKKLLKRYGTKTEFEFFFPPHEIMSDGKTCYAYAPTYYQIVAEAYKIKRANPSLFDF